MGDGATAQDAAATGRDRTARDHGDGAVPICGASRRRRATPVRVARGTARGRNRDAAARSRRQSQPRRRSRNHGRAADRDRSVRDRHRGAERGNPPGRAAPRSAISCSSKPGITGSSFAPGASSRPIIRGLDVNRVGIVENGVGGGGASDLGEDHFVPIDPLATNQIEVMRGPAALRYGSTSIGGVVSATNNRIPDALPTCAARAVPELRPACQGAARQCAPSCVTVETRTAVSSVDRGVEGGMLLDAGGGNFAVHADAYGRKAGDYGIPGYPYLFDPTRPFNGRQPNSAAQADGASVGGSYIFDGGFIGAAITQNDALYRIPGIDGADHQTRIDAHQTKFTAKGEYRPDAAAIDAIRFWAGATDYKHNEIGLADPTDPTTRRRAADLYQQGAGRPRRGAADAVQRALRRR